MSRELPPRPNLEHLRKQAKELLRAIERGDAAALDRARAAARPPAAALKLADAQHVVANEYGFADWAALRQHVESRLDPGPALVAAVRDDDMARARALLERHGELRAALNRPLPDAPFGALPILQVARRERLPMLDLLIEFGADINARSDWWAGSFGVLDDCRPEFAPELIRRGAIVTAHAAARLGMMDRLRELVERDPSLVDARGGDGQTPLHFAASVDVAEFLLAHGAGIDTLDVDHESTPAMWMLRERPEVARYLVARGGRTDLLMAVALGDLERVRRHLDADPAVIRMSVTERWFPKRNPHAGGCIYIWTLGINKTALRVAKEFGHSEVLALLLERSPAELQFTFACETGEERAMAELRTAHPDLVRSLTGAELRRLVDAAEDHDAQAVTRLLAAGWPVDARGQHGGTALHWAAWHGDRAMVAEILRYHPPLELRDQDFDGTPLSWAAYASVHGWHPDRGDYAGTVEDLIAAGARASVVRADFAASEPVRAVLERAAGR